jgi:thiol-disulfide isomerase/thioredoxin
VGIGNKKPSVESMILSNKIVFINWTSDHCAPCRNQKSKLVDIKKEVNSPFIAIYDVDYNKDKKKFKNLGNTVLPSLNVFIEGKPLTVIDTKMSPKKRVGILKKTEKVVDKKTMSIAGERQRADLIKLFKHSLEELSGYMDDASDEFHE